MKKLAQNLHTYYAVVIGGLPSNGSGLNGLDGIIRLMTMTGSAISKVDITATLEKIRALTGQTRAEEAAIVPGVKKSSFDHIMSVAKASLSDINQSQLQTESLKKAWLGGDPTVSISQVMMSTMKSKLAFEGLLVVRNKLLDSYKEIMNMPV